MSFSEDGFADSFVIARQVPPFSLEIDQDFAIATRPFTRVLVMVVDAVQPCRLRVQTPAAGLVDPEG